MKSTMFNTLKQHKFFFKDFRALDVPPTIFWTNIMCQTRSCRSSTKSLVPTKTTYLLFKNMRYVERGSAVLQDAIAGSREQDKTKSRTGGRGGQ